MQVHVERERLNFNKGTCLDSLGGAILRLDWGLNTLSPRVTCSPEPNHALFINCAKKLNQANPTRNARYTIQYPQYTSCIHYYSCPDLHFVRLSVPCFIMIVLLYNVYYNFDKFVRRTNHFTSGPAATRRT